MRLEPTPKPDHVLRVSARLITSSAILHFSSDELEHAVAQEQMENPALDVSEQRVCLFCGSLMQGPVCTLCGNFAQPTEPVYSMSELPLQEESLVEQQWSDYHHYDIDEYSGSVESDEDEEFDLLARIPMDQTLTELLLQQLETLTPLDDAPVAEQLVGNLNERGYLEASIQEIAEQTGVPVERVEYVLRQLQTLEPLGIGARNLRECLLIQLSALGEQEKAHPLAYTLIDRYLDRLGQGQFQEIARELKVSETAVRQAALYIRATLNPYPGHSYNAEIRYVRPGSGTTYMRPDIIIRRGENGFEVELIEEKRYRFRIGSGYGTRPLNLENEFARAEIQRYMHSYTDRARFFIDCLQRRWRTLKRVSELIVDYQREFLEKGVRYLRPLTRAEVATRLNLDEGTVSRATANKYALLPNGRLMPLSDFFDGSLGIKDVLRELIASENPRHRLSDEELARMMQTKGISMARRTVTKYREEMGIASSRER